MTVNEKGSEAGGKRPEVEDGKIREGPSTEPKKVEIKVNSQKVETLDGPMSGLEIKEEAIRQGIGIKPNFVLQQEMPNGTAKIIGNDDKIIIRECPSFTAIEPDDNS